jgi:hypothetical protein
MINAIQSSYDGHVATISGTTVSYPLLQGVLQGDTIAPYLFLFILDAILFQAMEDKDGMLLKLGSTSRKTSSYENEKKTKIMLL